MSTFTIFLVLITIVCFLLVLVIMVQNPKGGGLSSTLGGGGQIGGVQKTSDFLDKSTWTLATALIILILLSALSFTGTFGDSGSKLIDPNATPAQQVPAATPADGTATPATPATTAPAAPADTAQ
ncbi:preprotein translocase subunit SecG [Flavobacterium sp. NST-5]|uniref:Protein-export membrane protein SecG n=1 Tax=Flavobacterium ichthyis TaxID=2698827 RepID=A0ABW9Z7J8_9FLAO|nr:preprotein translocase subunit SecG [Flavobacterium ichthyis]NBL63814.1 preprotein translocase subunit SecG [Flavobacterium ichthyis]